MIVSWKMWEKSVLEIDLAQGGRRSRLYDGDGIGATEYCFPGNGALYWVLLLQLSMALAAGLNYCTLSETFFGIDRLSLLVELVPVSVYQSTNSHARSFSMFLRACMRANGRSRRSQEHSELILLACEPGLWSAASGRWK